jgi:glycosyltransferase involved in cell wall biosynthesis
LTVELTSPQPEPLSPRPDLSRDAGIQQAPVAQRLTSITGILFAIPWPSNEGYAMHRAESQFYEVGLKLTSDVSRIHFSFADMSGGHPRSLPPEFSNCASFSFMQPNLEALERLLRYVEENHINVVVGYDLNVESRIYRSLRQAGVQTIVAYWGAPMSSLNSWPKLFLKKLEVLLRRNRPDLFVFQCEAMRSTATGGRGIPYRETAVVYTGVDTSLLLERDEHSFYAHDAFGIPRNKKIVVFSGHVVERKGILVLLKAAELLINASNRNDIHFVILGRIQPESRRFIETCARLGLEHAFTFAGYRSDVFPIFASCAVGVIPTTGWDSFPRSVLEMQGCGLPILASRLQGLPEMIEEGQTGLSFTVGDHAELAAKLDLLLSDRNLNRTMGRNARRRVLREFDQARLISELARLVHSACRATGL